MIVAGIAVVVIAVIGMVDFSITSSKVPEVPEPCNLPGDAVCEKQRNEEFDARLDRALELEDGFEQRAWFYAGGALAAVLIGLVMTLRRTEPSARREVFTDLGVASVVGLGAGLILAAGGALDSDPDQAGALPATGAARGGGSGHADDAPSAGAPTGAAGRSRWPAGGHRLTRWARCLRRVRADGGRGPRRACCDLRSCGAGRAALDGGAGDARRGPGLRAPGGAGNGLLELRSQLT
jgi:hypothetical protein